MSLPRSESFMAKISMYTHRTVFVDQEIEDVCRGMTIGRFGIRRLIWRRILSCRSVDVDGIARNRSRCCR